MLTRPGAGPGCSWMRSWSTAASEVVPETTELSPRRRRLMKWFWILFTVYFIAMMIVTGYINRAGPPPPQGKPYESSFRIVGLPLVSYGADARGIIAIGGRAVGVVAIGGLALGVIAIGGLALGGIALSGLSLAILAIGGCTLGWWAVGGASFGYFAFGGLAMGGYAYAGNGIAFGYYEASGRQRERLLGS